MKFKPLEGHIPEERRLDKLGRRKRHSVRQQREDLSCRPTRLRLQIIQFLLMCGGGATTSIIHEWVKLSGVCKPNLRSLQETLSRMHHELGYTDRPKFQQNVDHYSHPDYYHRVSDLGRDLYRFGIGQRLLGKDWIDPTYFPRPGGAGPHQMMAACLYASYYVHALKLGIPFTHQHEICTASDKKIDVLFGGTEKLIPDGMFMLTIGEKPVLIFLEADRATEPGSSDDDKRKSWGATIEQYKRLINDGLYKTYFNVPEKCGALCHIVTLPDEHGRPMMERKIMKQIERVFSSKGKCPNLMVYTSYDFGEGWYPPKWMPMLDTVWERYGMGGYRLHDSHSTTL